MALPAKRRPAGRAIASWVEALEGYLTLRRLAVAAAVLLAVNVIATVIWMATIHNGLDVRHQPLGGDFIIFYSASTLTLHGEAARVFDPERLLAVQQMIVPGIRPGQLWWYPPTFQMLIAPLALAPFPVAFGLFMLTTATCFFGVIQSIVPGRLSLLLTAAFPGVLVNFSSGQNGFLTASLLGLGLLLMDRRPWLAGAVLGLLVIKPQLALLLPILLLGTGRWKPVIAAAICGAVVCAASALALGATPWIAFFRTTSIASANLATGNLPLERIPSLFIFVRWLGLAAGAAYAIQILASVIITAATLWAWRRSASLDLKLALALFATFLVTPYSFNYDLVLLAIPIALVARFGLTYRLPPGGKLILLLAAFTPNIFLGFAKLTHIQLMPLSILTCYIWVFLTLARTSDSAARARRTMTRAASSPSALSLSNSLSRGARMSA